MTAKQKGFSLIELLIVVAIILVIAGIAIPNLLRSRIAANEASAVRSIRSIDTAEVAYAATYPSIGYANNLATLGPGTNSGNTSSSSTNAILLDSVLACANGTGTTTCSKSGYNFLLTGGTPVGGIIYTYVTSADPMVQEQTGHRHFFSSTPGFITYNETNAATSTDAPLQ
jgi:prepilin-type N-terminal cleavage/methylation domain-containing protein